MSIEDRPEWWTPEDEAGFACWEAEDDYIRSLPVGERLDYLRWDYLVRVEGAAGRGR
jgi:hypothetical protein